LVVFGRASPQRVSDAVTDAAIFRKDVSTARPCGFPLSPSTLLV
jgi:hypothetical protein